MSTDDVINAWHRIDEWLRQHASAIASDLGSPATNDAIAGAEAELHLALPEDVRTSFNTHDGQRGSAHWPFARWRLLSLVHMVEQFQMLQDLRAQGALDVPDVTVNGPARAVWLAPSWVPLLADGTGDYVMVDLDPAPGGVVGQLIEYSGRDPIRTVVARAWSEWLSRWADDFDQGRYRFDEQDGLIRIG